MIVAREKRFFVVGKSAVYEALANLINGMNNKMFVVDAGKDFGGDFIGFE